MPDIEIYGQNEIYEIAQDKSSQRKLLTRFLETGQQDSESIIQEALSNLTDNRKKLLDAQTHVAAVEDEVARLPKLEEQVGQFKSLGLEDKLKIVPLLEMEKRLLKRASEEEGPNLAQAFLSVRDSLPDTAFLSETVFNGLPHAEILRKIRDTLNSLRAEAEILLSQWQGKYAEAKTKIALLEHIRSEIRNQIGVVGINSSKVPTTKPFSVAFFHDSRFCSIASLRNA